MAVLFVGVDVMEGVERVASEGGGVKLAGSAVHQTNPGLWDTAGHWQGQYYVKLFILLTLYQCINYYLRQIPARYSS